MALPENTILAERYLLRRVIGAGGFGITYQAFDTLNNTDCAIKEFVPTGVAQRERNGELTPETENKRAIFLHARKRFMEEAMTLKRLAYIPQVVRITDYFYENNSAYFVMEFLRGQTLRQVDYTLLATFVCFFVFVASVKACEPVRAWLETMMARSPMAVSLLTSQVISNVPACLLLSPFTQDAKALALGVDLGGLGTLIASLASLISFRLYGACEGAQKGRYFAVFTGVNLLFLAVMLGLAAIL